MFKNFFGKKNDGFYLQIEENSTPQKPAAKAKAKTESVETPATPATATATTASTPAPAAKKADKKAAPKVEAPKVEAAPVAAALPITNFATDYLIKPSSNSGRRLPGANMSQFLELARQAKKPVNIK